MEKCSRAKVTPFFMVTITPEMERQSQGLRDN